jgi:hypothetical protein
MRGLSKGSKNLGKIGEITGSGSDVIGAGLAVASALDAKEGLAYNLHTFSIGAPASTGEGSSADTGITLMVFKFLKLETSEASEAEFMLRIFTDGQKVYGVYTQLGRATGYGTQIGDQASVEFDGTEWGGAGYLLTFQGFQNPMGDGYNEFSGAVLITPDGKIIPKDARITRDLNGEEEFMDEQKLEIWNKGYLVPKPTGSRVGF